ncbi:DUF2845 domain-containing protein [Desulfococcus sp.]|uniref:DUF2845 domain-containing protein n=1 Tax=Desulfococcus sp. TaxID=2025834 RepID=UPI00359333D4
MNPKLTFLLAVLVAALIASPASALRCSGKVIDRGMTSSEVIENCGTPTWVDERQEERFSRNCRDPFFDTYPDDDRGYDEHYYIYRGKRYTGCKKIVTIEEWFYNFGSSRLTQTLIFENSRLVHIRQGGYGY